MAETRGLPFGRPPQQAPKNSWVDERRRSLPAANGWLLSTLSGEVFTEVSDGGLTADLLVLNRLAILDADYLLTQSAIGVTGGSAATTAYSGLYLLVRDGRDLVFKLISGTKATYSAATPGRVEAIFKEPVQLRAGMQLFTGAIVSSVVPTFVIAQGHTTHVEKVRTLSVTTLPGSVGVSATTASTTTASTLLVTYYSAEAALVV